MRTRRKRESPKKLKTLRLAMFDFYRGICQCCGIQTSFEDYTSLGGIDGHRILGPTYPTLEHIVPRAFNGTANKDNVTLFCSKCNLAGGRLIERRIWGWK